MVLGLCSVEGTREVACLSSLYLQTLSTMDGVVSQGQDTWVPVAALLWIGQCLALSKPQFPKEQED